ncbi:unnamed protein product [Gordionus sp. m RMFG-2023]
MKKINLEDNINSIRCRVENLDKNVITLVSDTYNLNKFCKFMIKSKRQNNNSGNDGFKILSSFDDTPYRRMTSALAHIISESNDSPPVYRHPHSKRIIQFAFGDSTFYPVDEVILKLPSLPSDLHSDLPPKNAILPRDIVSVYDKLDFNQKMAIEKVLKNVDPLYSIDLPPKDDSNTEVNLAPPILPIMIIHGGPGTGKTTVLVQIILRAVLQLRKKILICSSSNVAVDNIGLRLLRTFQNDSDANEDGSFISPPTILRLGSSAKIMNLENLTWKERPEGNTQQGATTKTGGEKIRKRSREKFKTKDNKTAIRYTLHQHLCQSNPSSQLLKDLENRLSTTLKMATDHQQQICKLPTSHPKCQSHTARNIKLNSDTNDTNSNASSINDILETPSSHQTEMEIRQLLKEAELEIIRSADIILSTLISFGKYALKAERFDMLIIDECSQSLEAACWIPMLHAPFCLLAGDHLQLPPTIISKDPVTKEGLQISLMERLIGMYAKDEPISNYSSNPNHVKKMFLPSSFSNYSSNFLENWEVGVKRQVENDFLIRLNMQYRMNECIAKFISDRFYDSRLTTPPHVATRVLSDLISNIQYGPLVLIDTFGFEHVLPSNDNAQIPACAQCMPKQMTRNTFNIGLNSQNNSLLGHPVIYNNHHTLNAFIRISSFNNPCNSIPVAQRNMHLLNCCNRADSGISSSPGSFNDSLSSSLTREVSGKTSKANLAEVECVYLHVTRLMNSGLGQSDIGIISPYSFQIELLNRKLSHIYPDIEIKSVDGFQGKEKEVIILSLVRSNPSGDIGFLQDSRRVNVALTRAKKHLCIVCDISHYFLLKSKIKRYRENGYGALSAFLTYALINGQTIHHSNGKVSKNVSDLASRCKMITVNKMDDIPTSNEVIANVKLAPINAKTPTKHHNQIISKKSINVIAQNFSNTHISTKANNHAEYAKIKSFILDLHRHVIDFAEKPFPGHNSNDITTYLSMLSYENEFIDIVRSLENTYLISFCKKIESSLIHGRINFEYLPNRKDYHRTLGQNDDETNICREIRGNCDVVDKCNDSSHRTFTPYLFKYTFSSFVLSSEIYKYYARHVSNKLERCLEVLSVIIVPPPPFINLSVGLTLVFEVRVSDVRPEANTPLIKFAQLCITNEGEYHSPVRDNGNDAKVMEDARLSENAEMRTPKCGFINNFMSNIKKKIFIKNFCQTLDNDAINILPSYNLPYVDKQNLKRKDGANMVEQSSLDVSLNKQGRINTCYKNECKFCIFYYGFPCRFSCVAYKFCLLHYRPETHDCIYLRGM